MRPDSVQCGFGAVFVIDCEAVHVARVFQEAVISTHHSHEAAVFNNPRAARAFADYLSTLSIANKIVDSTGESQVILLDAGASARFHAELKAFLENPEDERYLAASWAAGDISNAADASALGRVYGRKRFRLRGRRAGPVTWVVIVACLVVFVEFNLGDPLGWWRRLQFFPAWRHLLQSGEWWRWLTASISHYQVLHIAFNLLWWWDLAGNVERRQGSLRLLTLFVLLNVVSNFCQFVFSGPNFLGLSGVVYGLLGYLWAYVKMCPRYPQPVNDLVFRSMIIWLVVCFTGVVDLLIQGGIANAAHLGGLLAGIALGYWWGFLDRKTW